MSSTVAALKRTLTIVCPQCTEPFAGVEEFHCRKCQKTYPLLDGFPDLIVGNRYDDPTPEEAILAEEITNRRTVEDYYIPLFSRIWPGAGASAAPRVLSLGCGVGTDVEALCEAGYDAYGIDNGKRSAEWKRRKFPERLFMANGAHMPFPSETFDAVFCGCVFPHVGVQGFSYAVTPDYHEQRLELARGIVRVLKPDGRVIASNPNRYFPFDIFHEHTAERMRMRFNPPWNPLLLSRGDYERLFREAGCARAGGLPVARYWSFANSRRTLKGRILSAPVRFLFQLCSFKPLRTSMLNPWIIVLIEKGAPARI